MLENNPQLCMNTQQSFESYLEIRKRAVKQKQIALSLRNDDYDNFSSCK